MRLFWVKGSNIFFYITNGQFKTGKTGAHSWASAGEGKRGLLPPLAGQNSIFLTILRENCMILGIFKANSMFLPPPLENFALPWKKVCGRTCAHSLPLFSVPWFSTLMPNTGWGHCWQGHIEQAMGPPIWHAWAK